MHMHALLVCYESSWPYVHAYLIQMYICSGRNLRMHACYKHRDYVGGCMQLSRGCTWTKRKETNVVCHHTAILAVQPTMYFLRLLIQGHLLINV
jgi:hypothetical protein